LAADEQLDFGQHSLTDSDRMEQVANRMVGDVSWEENLDALHSLLALVRLPRAASLIGETRNHLKLMRTTFDLKEECEQFALELMVQTLFH
jgi:hypothetical protein